MGLQNNGRVATHRAGRLPAPIRGLQEILCNASDRAALILFLPTRRSSGGELWLPAMRKEPPREDAPSGSSKSTPGKCNRQGFRTAQERCLQPSEIRQREIGGHSRSKQRSHQEHTEEGRHAGYKRKSQVKREMER